MFVFLHFVPDSDNAHSLSRIQSAAFVVSLDKGCPRPKSDQTFADRHHSILSNRMLHMVTAAWPIAPIVGLTRHCRCVCLSLRLFLFLFFCLSHSLCVCLSHSLFFCLSVCVSPSLSVCMSEVSEEGPVAQNGILISTVGAHDFV